MPGPGLGGMEVVLGTGEIVPNYASRAGLILSRSGLDKALMSLSDSGNDS